LPRGRLGEDLGSGCAAGGRERGGPCMTRGASQLGRGSGRGKPQWCGSGVYLSRKQTGVLSSPSLASEQRGAEGGLQLGQWGKRPPTGPVRRGLRLRGGSFFPDMASYFGDTRAHKGGDGIVGHCTLGALQPFSQKVRMPTVAKDFQISLYDHVEADMETFGDSCSAGFFGGRPSNKELQFIPPRSRRRTGLSNLEGIRMSCLPRFRISIANLQKRAVAERREAKPTT